MLERKNNIDNLFSDKLSDYQEDVSHYVFENIQNQLNINAGKTDIDNLFSDNLKDYQEDVPDYVFENIQNKLNIKAGNTNIDVLFSDYLYNYQETTPNYVFSEIKSELKKQKAKKVSLRLQKIAASIAILLAFGIGYFSSEINNTNQKFTNNFSDSIFWLKKEQVDNSNTAKKEDSISKFNKSKTKQNIDVVNNSNLNSRKANFVKINQGSTFLSEFKDFTSNIFASKEKEKINSSKNNKYKSKTAKYNQLLTDSMLLADGNPYNQGFMSDNGKNKKSRWTFGTKFSPVFSFSKNNEQGEVISENEKESSSEKSAIANNTPEIEFNEKPLTTFTSGLNVNFRISKRWSIQSGLYYSKRKQISENLTSSTSFYDENQMRVFTPAGDKIIDQPVDIMNNIKGEDILSRNREETFYSLDMNYISNFKYIELPIIFRFKIIDKKVDLEVLSGISTNFLVGNNASIMIEEKELWKGVNEDISPLLYDATFGFGLNYNFYENFNFSLEPTFKYNIVKQNANIQNYPYSFAVFAGFSYTF